MTRQIKNEEFKLSLLEKLKKLKGRDVSGSGDNEIYSLFDQVIAPKFD